MLKMPYYKNEAAVSGAIHGHARHEDALAGVLLGAGFLSYRPVKKLERKVAMTWREQPELAQEIPNGVFIEQPFGTHNAPDFLVKIHEKAILFLEAKSSATTTCPTFNSGGVKEGFLYVFCSKKTNQTTIFLGQSVVTREQQRLIDQHIKEARQRDVELNEQLRALDKNHRGIAYYTRPMILQGGGRSYTNYFTHALRKETEATALKWVEDIAAE
jgi:hypothetical protein